MRKRRKTSEHKVSAELRVACEEAFNEQKGSHPRTAVALLALGRVVPKLANAIPGWSHGPLTRSFFGKHRKGVH